MKRHNCANPGKSGWKLSIQVLCITVGALCCCLLLIGSTAVAETTEYGGYPDRFKGKGDTEPPQCGLTLPRAAIEPFFVQWYCVDDVSPSDEIRSELWILRNGALAPDKIKDFLGFPASVLIDEAILQVGEFTDGLPVSVRLVARDRAGNAVITPFILVLSQDNSLNTCDLQVITEATESTGDTTGVPSLSVVVDKALVATQQLSDEDLRVFTPTEVLANPCEIDSICVNNSELRFDSSLTLAEEEEGLSAQTASGTVNVTPGDVSADVSGTAEVESGALQSLNVTGSTVVDGQDATVTLTCER